MQKKTIHLKDYFQPMLLLVLLLALVVFLSIYSDAFMSAKNWRNIFDNHMAHQLLLGIGMLLECDVENSPGKVRSKGYSR